MHENIKHPVKIFMSGDFEMKILFNENSCSVDSNGQYHFSYKYRYPLDKITQVNISLQL